MPVYLLGAPFLINFALLKSNRRLRFFFLTAPCYYVSLYLALSHVDPLLRLVRFRMVGYKESELKGSSGRK